MGRYLTNINADLFAINSATKEAGAILRKEKMREVDIVPAWRGALGVISGVKHQISPLVGDTIDQSKQLRSQGHTLGMLHAPEDKSTEETSYARVSAKQAA